MEVKRKDVVIGYSLLVTFFGVLMYSMYVVLNELLDRIAGNTNLEKIVYGYLLITLVSLIVGVTILLINGIKVEKYRKENNINIDYIDETGRDKE